MIYEYPALFYTDDDKVAFHFCDIENLRSFGDNLDEAILAAEEILADCLLHDAAAAARDATPLNCVEVKPLQVVRMIRVDTDKYAAELNALQERDSIFNADNPIKELLTRRNMKIKQLADLLECPYRTAQEWSLGNSKPPAWVLKLIVDKVLG